MINPEIETVLRKVQKPARYTGGEWGSVVKNKSNVNLRFAFCFPDTYEVGMSYLGMKILYSLYNSIEDVWCERVFAPCGDMEAEMRRNHIALFGLESGDRLSEFDIIGFTLQYELSYTNILNMLELADIPLLAKDRGDDFPLVIGGGPCACNPEPVAAFFDLFCLGEGEEVSIELIDLIREYKSLRKPKRDLLLAASKIEGIYIPSLYEVEYKQGVVSSILQEDGAPEKITKRIIKDMNKAHYPKSFVMPYIDIVHDRAIEEVFRGCMRGCRFCQAGYIYRPKREKSPETVISQSRDLCESTGYEELSLLSLSTSDYTKLDELLPELLTYTDPKKINLALPSLRVDNFSEELAKKLRTVRQSGLTFAPEAGSQRLRDVINKNVTEEELLTTCKTAFENGYSSVKLYFMIGLPTETDEDVIAIASLANAVLDTYFNMPVRPFGRNVSITVSVSSFVPKPFTPFQWCPQNSIEELSRKQRLIVGNLKSKKIHCSWHDSKTSFLEGAFARGDRRLSKVILKAFQKGCKFDGWGEYFDFEKWEKAFREEGLSMEEYSTRQRDLNEILPWSHLDYGVSEEFLKREYHTAFREKITKDCKNSCAFCGASKWGEGICVERRQDHL